MRGLGLGKTMIRQSQQSGTPLTLVTKLAGLDFQDNCYHPELTVIANAVDGPSGHLNATKVAEKATTDIHYISTPGADVTSGEVYTVELIIAPGGTEALYVALYDGAQHSVNINLTTGVVVVPYGGATASVSLLTNGYYKLSIVFTASATATVSLDLYSFKADGTSSYLGDVTKSYSILSLIVTK